MKRKLLVFVSMVLCMAFVFSLSVDVFAGWYDPSMPSLSSTNYCEFISPRSIAVFRDKACNTRGTCSPAKSYSTASIAKGDKCYAYEISESSIKVNYPTSSGRRTGYIRRSDISDIFSMKCSYGFISQGKINVYTVDGIWYGYTEKNDTIICCWPYLDGCPNRLPIIYTAKSGNRGYKAGWVSLSDYHRILS